MTETAEALRQKIAELEAQVAALKQSQETVFAQHEQQVQQQTNIAGDSTTIEGNDNLVGDASRLTHLEKIKTSGGHIIIAGEGAKVIVGEPPVETPAVEPASALAHYLRHLIAQNRYLALQGIRSGGKLVSIELEQIYVTLRATRQRVVSAGEEWLSEEMRRLPDELAVRRFAIGSREKSATASQSHTETVTVSVNEALDAHLHLVVLGDPGSGKTTLLRYLTLLYAHDMAEGGDLVATRLGLAESGFLPVLVPLRRLASYLKTRRPTEDGTEGCALLLEYLWEMLVGEQVPLPQGFFNSYLETGEAVVLLDGLDEVADPEIRRRVARLVDTLTISYPQCRFIVTSRIVGYSGSARLGGDFAATTIRDFTDADIMQFLHNWHLAVAVGEMGPGESAHHRAEGQTQQLFSAIQANARVRELALNPLLLTVIALVHRDRVNLPDRRAELYAEAVDVLLGKWDEAKGVREIAVLVNQPFDAKDKKLLLQRIALTMQEERLRDIELSKLLEVVHEYLREITTDVGEARRATERFLQVVEERAGLLIGRGEGVYAFSHLTFQEYLAALSVAARDDYVAYTLARCREPWWRETILLEAGYLSSQSRERTTRLVKEIAECKQQPAPYHNLVLAAEILRDVGGSRVETELETQVQRQLRQVLEKPRPAWSRRLGKVWTRTWVQQRATAMEALGRVGAGYWTLPNGEPEWVEIPAGEFWMGSEEGDGEERPVHKVHLERYWIAKVPITNAQYRFFVEICQYEPPNHWEDGKVPRGLESHPVTRVTWHDAIAYCRWLSEVSSKSITLPSEAEWEKAARGETDKRKYPWGDAWKEGYCNSSELSIGGTTPVGIFSDGTSPYGCFDMAGNVWEWTRSLWGKYMRESDFRYVYRVDDGRENTEIGDGIYRVLRGGAFNYYGDYARCTYRNRNYPFYWDRTYGFRVCVVSRQE
ncbi:MAG: SUMF1/EgtB/PvdO family nonheme iron enzyme [Anaerolineae bacterium]|nr:SUMF1/EgtB/PvdO family nonheme iron enzyme [Anaerolineae bacterium]